MSRDITTATEPEATLTIQQMAARSGMSEYTLRYYEKIGLIQPIPRNESSGHRRYSAETVQVVETLACLRASGLSLDDMRRYLRLREYGREAAAEQKALFQTHAEKVAEEIRQLEIRQRFLDGKVAYWDAQMKGDTELSAQIAARNREIAKELK
ncbi:MerR family transcriptional regulator [Ktedonobacter sp. SOSP1-85]|uniref:MerR family transcriptional regulator n=1 Tax=Ktedonobacter sp. SOSP1-85 TaxID=2778367 RepID=UPI001915943E|nr:MerR family transcriptional regulator [Ktedonobacter sp. SOSP1-85]GHO77946.1 MerR family transcriptional regulator [Ktedonobacter sp. SOSP1-85]